MAKIPTSKVVRRRDGEVVTVNSHEIAGDIYTVNGMSKARKGRQPLRSADRGLGQSAEFNRIGAA